MLDFLPQMLKNALTNLNINNVYELRLRVEQPVKINYKGKYRYLSQYGLTEQKKDALYCTRDDVEDCVFKAGNCSVYSVEEQIKNGFITAKNGERIGLAGEYVFDKGMPLTIRNFTSLCIRVPHNVIGCANNVFQRCMSDKLISTLICSPPGIGKTTILRDLARLIAQNYHYNLLICDERGEISACGQGEDIDVLKFCNKSVAFEAGVRAMRPDVIITDELSVADISAIERAVYAGIYVIASAHYDTFLNVDKRFLPPFKRFVFLNPYKIGEIQAIYNEKGEEME